LSRTLYTGGNSLNKFPLQKNSGNARTEAFPEALIKGDSMPVKLNLTGQRFTRLIALHEAGKDQQGNIQWLCKCDCQNTVIVSAARLQCGNVKSCGCLRQEQAIETQKKATAAVIRDGTSKNILSKVINSNTGVRGVSYNKFSRKYEAKLVYQGEVRFRGSFKKLSEAIAARQAAEKKWLEPLVEKWK